MLRPLLRCAAALLAALSCCTFAFDLQGHRGARGLAPENTLPAFARALDVGVSTLELDVALTADDVLVVSHDPFLNPVLARDASGAWLAGARGPLIRTLTLAQLQAFDVGRIRPDTPYARTFASQQAVDGTRVPTLAQVFALVRARGAPVRFNIETKLFPDRPGDTASVEALTDALLAAIDEAGLRDRVTIQSFDWRSLVRVRQRAPAIATACLTVQSANSDSTRDGTWTAGLRLADHGSVPKLARAAGCAIWSPNAGALTQPLLQEARALGLATIPWTVNEPDDMDRLAAWGVDGLITDRPDRAREVLQRRGIALPAPAP